MNNSINRSTVNGVNVIHGWDSGTGAANQLRIYEVGLTYPVDITSGWYQIKWVDTNSDNSNGVESDVNGKYVKNYASDVTVNGANYSLYLDAAPSTLDAQAMSLVYFDYSSSSGNNGVYGYLRSANGHYVTTAGTASSSKSSANYLIRRSSSTPQYTTITSGNSDPRNSLIPKISDETHYIGQSAENKFPVAEFYKVTPSDLGLQAWSVTIDEGDNAQVSYTGSDASGLTSVYNGGTFFLTAGVTPTASEFSAPTYNGISPFIAVDATNHKIVVSYAAVNKVYTLTNATYGALIYDPGNSATNVWSSGKSGATAFDATNANHQWVFIPTGTANQYYLYNVGAQKFAIPTTISNGVGNPWVFSENAVALTYTIESDNRVRIKMATAPVSGTYNGYISFSNNNNPPVINHTDAGSYLTITKVDGDQSAAANAAVAKLVKNQTALTAAPSTTGWYAIQIKSKTGAASYAGRYLQNATSLYNSLYPLTFTGSVDVQPAITDPTFFTRVSMESSNNYWQLPDGRYLAIDSNKKFPTVSTTPAEVIAGYEGGNYFKSTTNYYADPYNSSASYYIGETVLFRTTYNVYPIDLETAGLVAWQLAVGGLSSDAQITCTRSDVKGLTSVYNSGYFFLPTGVTPAANEFSTTIDGNTFTLSASIDSEEKTIMVSIPVLTINSPMAEATFTWNGESKTGKTVTFPYTGQEITDNTISVSYTGSDYNSPELSQTTWDGTASTTVTCTMTPAFFSASYGDKWVRIISAKNSDLAIELNEVAGGANAMVRSRDFFSEKQLWCFVGSRSSFTLYNKAAADSYVLTSGAATPGQNTTITLQPTASASNAAWALDDMFDSADSPGYALYLSGASGSYGMHGWQSGNVVKYWDASSGGSHFLIEDASGEVTLALTGLDTSAMTDYTKNIANLPATIAGAASQTLLTKDNFSSRTAYVPNGSELTFGTPALFQNYGFTGYDGTDQTKTVTATATPQAVTATFSVVRPDARYLWEPLRTSASDYYRIPAIVTAKNGDIIAINDRRFNNASDIGGNHHIDLIGIASSDNGATWGSEFMIMDGDNGSEKGYGDAAVVADRESNKVLVMACGGNVSYQNSTTDNHQVIVRTVLTHNGTTWVASAITTHTSQFYSGDLAECPAMFIGSGSITQSSIIKKGDYYRIYCAVLAKNYGNYVLYSDDFGATWTYLGSSSAAASGDEAKVTELPDGSVLLSSRKGYGRYFNIWAWADDTYTSGSWGTAVATNSQTGGISFGSNSTNGDIRMIPAIKKATGELVTLAMQSVPTGSGRSNVSIFYKELANDGAYTSPATVAQNWSSAYEVTPHNSAYSAFNPQPDGRIAFFMEEAPISMSESSVGYYLCYVPLTVDEITSNTYTGIASTYDLTLTPVDGKSYATLYLPYGVTLPDDVTAYKIRVSGDRAVPTEIGQDLPAETAALLVSESGVTSALATLNSSASADATGNALLGVLTATSGEDLKGYVLNIVDGELGFFKLDNGGTLAANRAYLPASLIDGTGVKGVVLNWDEETGVGELKNESMEEGKSSTLFDLSGRRISVRPVLPKGIYILNGRKVIVK